MIDAGQQKPEQVHVIDITAEIIRMSAAMCERVTKGSKLGERQLLSKVHAELEAFLLSHL